MGNEKCASKNNVDLGQLHDTTDWLDHHPEAKGDAQNLQCCEDVDVTIVLQDNLRWPFLPAILSVPLTPHCLQQCRVM